MNSFGRIFRVSIFGESHGTCVGVVVDGCPAGIALCADDFLTDLIRRKSGAGGTTTRMEDDVPEILSGIYNGCSTGAPITVVTRNRNCESSSYDIFKNIYRPGHADFVAHEKYHGCNDIRGGGHFSGRVTWGMVAAGVVAKKILDRMSISATLLGVGGGGDIEEAVNKAVSNNNSIGGIVECVVDNVPVGFGEPFFDSVESVISHVVFSIPGIKGIEFGKGFAAATMTGYEYNDCFIDEKGSLSTNNSGGINGGITNGNQIVFRVAVRPAASIGLEQKTFNFTEKKMDSLKITGRHDACIALRVPVIVEAAAAIALADLKLINDDR